MEIFRFIFAKKHILKIIHDIWFFRIAQLLKIDINNLVK